MYSLAPWTIWKGIEVTEKENPIRIEETHALTLTPFAIPSCGTHSHMRKEGPTEATDPRNSMNGRSTRLLFA